jgi:hypothetical protein
MSISIIGKLCGNQIIESKSKGFKNKIYEFRLNLYTLKNYLETLIKRKSCGLNSQILLILELATNKNNTNNFIDE